MKIEIFDQTYNVNADGNEEYLTELAAFVDKKMRTIAEQTQLVDSVKVAVLAALNIADETFALRQRNQKLEGPIRQRMEKCVTLVEKALEQASEYGHSFEREVAFLFVHGMLHVLGFDHITKEQEADMFGRQRKILAEAGFKR